MFGDTEPPEEHTHNLLVVQVTSKGLHLLSNGSKLQASDDPPHPLHFW